MRLILTLLFGLMNIVSVRSQGILVDHTCVDDVDRTLSQQDLDKARTLKVFFGHQSVGNNIMDGLRDLAKLNPDRYACNIQRIFNPNWYDHNHGFGEAPIGKNGSCSAKVEDFVKRMNEGLGERVDVAMMKFCFVDFTPKDNPEKDWRLYREGLETVEKAHPKVRVVWWTSPLMAPSNNRRALNQLKPD